MRKPDSTSCLKWGALLLLQLPALPGAAQWAMAGKPGAQSLAYAGPVHQQASPKARTSLKEAVDQLKRQYNVRIAFREGLLNNKFVAADAAGTDNPAPGLEGNLRQLLPAFGLGFKRITAQQYVIYAAPSAPAPGDHVRGKVVFADGGTAVPGASVVLKGNAQVGTSSDADGNFDLTIPDANQQSITLVVSFVGYSSTEVVVTNRSAPLTVKLAKNDQALDEVVVTALGINKQKRALGYAVTEIKGEDLTQARENNVANALTGKVAGVNVAGISTGPGGSSRVIIRGNGSLSGTANNQPLYVVNGMPIDNSVPGLAPTANGGGSNVDRGDGIASINPDDIESITVLKGGTAAALYGSRGGNGVILITTKKGRAQQGIGVEYNGTFTAESISVRPDFQYEYGQGDGGVKPTTLAAANGVAGSPRYNDGQWFGFSGTDLGATLDLGTSQRISTLGTNVLNYHWQKMWAPVELVFSVSADGVTYQDVYRQTDFPVNGINPVRARIAPVQARYVRVRGVNQGVIPAGEYGAGGKAWLLLDEFLVN